MSERIVWKLGSESCTNEFGVDWERLHYYSGQLAEQVALGRENIVVISGAIAVANTMLSEEERQDESITLPMRATHGNPAYFMAWMQSLAAFGIKSGEVLITDREINDRREGKNFRDTLFDYMAAGWVSLINESGSTDNYESRMLAYGGDNDGLAEHVADSVGADQICFLTKKEGVLDDNKKLIRVVTAANAREAVRVARGPGPGGTGGMRTKVQKALAAAAKGRTAHIAQAAHPKFDWNDVLSGKSGTLFVPQSPQNIVR